MDKVSHPNLFRLSRSRAASVTFVKAVHTSGRIDELLFTGKKWMACRAYFYMQVVFQCRTRLKGTAACTNHRDLIVVWMYFLFHSLTSFAVYKRCDIAI